MRFLSPFVKALVLLAAVLCAFAFAGSAAAAKPGPWVVVVVHKHSGQVSAVLTAQRRHESFGGFDYRKLHLRITLEGSVVFDRGVCNESDCGPATHHTLRLANVWGDGTPEVLLDSYSGGAHCCFATSVYFVDGSLAGHTVLEDWGDPGYALKVHDGTVQFETADDRFAYAFTAYAFSGLPIELLTIDAKGAFQDVTTSRPDLLHADLKVWWKAYTSERGKADSDVRGVVASWCADEYLLGHGATCEAELKAALAKGYLKGPTGWPQNAKFVTFLHKQLRMWGYVPGPGSR